jgi:8-oxo-dGTP diphosphatase
MAFTPCTSYGKVVVVTVEPSRLAVGAIVRRESDILLVSQQADAEEPPVWALPGGVVEPGETVHDALLRDVRTDTGLNVRPGPLLWVARYELGGATWQSYGFAAVPDDPSAEPGTGAGWFPFVEAVDKLADMWFAPIREPAVQYLVGRAAAATLWTWASLENAPDVVPALVSS